MAPAPTASSAAADAMQARMLPLRQRYITNMAERIDALEHLLTALAGGSTPAPEQRDALISHAHKLAGSGGTYGFPEITVHGRALENALRDQPGLAVEAMHRMLQTLVQTCRDARQSVALPTAAPAAAAPEAPADMPPATAAPVPAARPLPQRPAGPAASGPPVQPAAAVPPATAPGDARRPKLLIVDDDPTVSELLAVLFNDDAEVLVEATPTAAFERMRAQRPDMVILDDNLVGADTHDGLKILDRMREHTDLRDIPVLMLTGQARPTDVIRGLSHGAADFVAKPFDPVALAAKVRARLKRLGTTVVVADEDRLLMELLAHRFRALGYRVFECSDGVALMDLLRARRVDLVIAEWLLPRIDGLTVAIRLRQDESFGRAPLILTSTRRTGSDMLEAFDAGVADYITKPIRLDELLARSQRLLTQRDRI